jgi:REP element-mobilizing transposase RayT
MKTLKQHINEKLFISKDTKQEISWDSFIEALLKHNDGTLELEKNNIEIFVSPPDKFASYTLLGRLKGRQITEIRVYGNRNDGYRISIDIDDDFQSGLTIHDIEDLIDVFGNEQIEQIYSMVL